MFINTITSESMVTYSLHLICSLLVCKAITCTTYSTSYTCCSGYSLDYIETEYII